MFLWTKRQLDQLFAFALRGKVMGGITRPGKHSTRGTYWPGKKLLKACQPQRRGY